MDNLINMIPIILSCRMLPSFPPQGLSIMGRNMGHLGIRSRFYYARLVRKEALNMKKIAKVNLKSDYPYHQLSFEPISIEPQNTIQKQMPPAPVPAGSKNRTPIPQDEKPINQALMKLEKSLQKIDHKKLSKMTTEEAINLEQNQHELAINQIRSLSLTDFSVLVHRCLINYSGQNHTYYQLVWKELQNNFLQRFEATTDPQKIRSFTKVLYSLAKVKTHREGPSTTITTSVSSNIQNFQTKFAILLPFASHQSFSMIVTSISRMGPLSQQFSYIVEKFYYSRNQEFNVRQKVQINYAITRNGRQVDSQLHTYITQMNLKQIVTMLRCYGNSNQLYVPLKIGKKPNLLSFAEGHIIARKHEMNAIDLAELCEIYFEGMLSPSLEYKVDPKMQNLLTESYILLRRNVNEVGFLKIWENFPQVVNGGHLPIAFVEQVLKTMKILRKKDLFPERIWKNLKQSFQKIQNLQLRAKLMKIE